MILCRLIRQISKTDAVEITGVNYAAQMFNEITNEVIFPHAGSHWGRINGVQLQDQTGAAPRNIYFKSPVVISTGEGLALTFNLKK